MTSAGSPINRSRGSRARLLAAAAAAIVLTSSTAQALVNYDSGQRIIDGIQLLQDLMLRGSTNHAWEIGALVAIAAVTLVAAWLLLRRNMRIA